MYSRCPQRFHFTGKNKIVVGLRKVIIKRLFAKTVTSAKECLLLFIPNSKCKHAVEILQTIFAITGIGSKNNFSIAMGNESEPFLDQIGLYFEVIVYFAIIRDCIPIEVM